MSHLGLYSFTLNCSTNAFFFSKNKNEQLLEMF